MDFKRIGLGIVMLIGFGINSGCNKNEPESVPEFTVTLPTSCVAGTGYPVSSPISFNTVPVSQEFPNADIAFDLSGGQCPPISFPKCEYQEFKYSIYLKTSACLIKAIYLKKIVQDCTPSPAGPYPEQVLTLSLNRHLDYQNDKITFSTYKYDLIEAIGIEFVSSSPSITDINSVIDRVGGICIIGNTGGPRGPGPCAIDPSLLAEEVSAGASGSN